MATWLQEGRKVKVQRCLLPNLKMNERKIIWGGNKNKTEPARVKLHRAPKQFPLSEADKTHGFLRTRGGRALFQEMVHNLKINPPPPITLKISAQMKISSSPRTCHNVTQSVKKKHAYTHTFSSPKQCQFGHLQQGFLFVFIYLFLHITH